MPALASRSWCLTEEQYQTLNLTLQIVLSYQPACLRSPIHLLGKQTRSIQAMVDTSDQQIWRTLLARELLVSCKFSPVRASQLLPLLAVLCSPTHDSSVRSVHFAGSTHLATLQYAAAGLQDCCLPSCWPSFSIMSRHALLGSRQQTLLPQNHTSWCCRIASPAWLPLLIFPLV